MAKNEKNVSAPPKGYQNQTIDVVGYWVPERGPIHFVPRGCKVFDGNINAEIPTILIVGILVDPCEVDCKDETGAQVAITLEAGQPVGVWYKAGMRGIRETAGVKVWMQQSGERDVGKPSPMKLFQIFAEKKGRVLPKIEDTRVESKDRKLFIDVERPPTKEEMDEIPF